MLGRRLARLELGDSISTALHASLADDARGPRVRAQIANAELLDEVAPNSSIRPTRVTGRLANGSADENRELALVVNGRIRSVGRSFHLGRRPTEFFSFVFPEHALRRGLNHVEVLEVVDGGRSFVPLGGNHGAGR